MFIDVWQIYFGPFGVNLNTMILVFLILLGGFYRKFRKQKTHLFEIAFLLFLAGFLYFTFHGKLLQLIFPISLPERPFVDVNLSANYALTSFFTFMFFPFIALLMLKREISIDKFGLRISNLKQTLVFTLLGLLSTVSLWLFNKVYLGFGFAHEYYTVEGIVAWFLLVILFSVFIQIFYFHGILFRRYLDSENGFLLVMISTAAYQSFIVSSWIGVITNVMGQFVKLAITWKTRNIYDAVLIHTTVNAIDTLVQVC